jgi:hypothetical protein
MVSWPGAVAVSGLSSREDVELATLALELIGAQKIPWVRGLAGAGWGI